ncbi:TPA: hypothetical protein MC498_004280 [Klebsiella oxytoca]|nr:hypothetical protein [Klebsiella oxytoca]
MAGKNIIRLRPINDRNLDKKDYLYQPRLFRGQTQTPGRYCGRSGLTFTAGLVTGALLTMAALLLYPQAVLAPLKMLVQLIDAVANRP